jgi:putative hydrolase of HD superfamily
MWKEIIEFSKIVGKLKKVKRMGWVRVGIQDPESVAEHSFSTAILAMVIADIKNLDKEKMIRMALLHDLDESIIGDLTPYDKQNFKKEELMKRKKEVEKQIISLLPEKLQEKYLEILEEHDENKTKEARIFEQIDKLEMAIQTLKYEKEGYGKDKLEEFWHFSENRISDSDLKKIFKLLKKERIK